MENKKRILAMSNIHGHLDEMLALLKEVNYDPQVDKLFILGDIVDYGPKTIETVEKVMQLRDYGAVILRGHKEQEYITAFTHRDEEKRNAAEEKICKVSENQFFYYEDYPEVQKKHIDFFKSLNPIYQYKDFIFAHAGIDIGNEDNSFGYSLYNGQFYERSEETKDSEMSYVFGHKPTYFMDGHKKSEVFAKEKMIGIDLGAVSPNGYLGLVELYPERVSHKIKLSGSFPSK